MRRKGFILTVMVALMASSCSQDRIVDLQQDNPIEFRVVMNRQSKAVSYYSSTLTSFNVTAWKSGTDHSLTAPHINEVDYDRTSDGTFKSAVKYYWPASGGLDFYAYAPAASLTNGLVRSSELSYTVTPLADTDSQIDLVFAKNSGNKTDNGSNGVNLNFRHTMAQIRIKVKNGDDAVKFNVTGWKVAGVDGSATFTFDDAVSNTNTEAANSLNTIDASMWSDNDDSYTATYSKTWSQATNVTLNSSTWGELDGSAILIPQNAVMATGYTGSDPASNPLNGAYIAVQYEALNTSNDDEIVAAGTWGCWPVDLTWEPGFRYNYVIDLSQFGYKEQGKDDLEPVINNDAEVKFVTVTIDPWQPEDDNDADVDLPLQVVYRPYLRFHTEGGTQALGIVNVIGNATETNLEYSLDEGATWSVFNYPSDESEYLVFGDYNNTSTDLLLRGSGVGFYNEATSVRAFTFAVPNQLVDCTGSINSLTNPADPAADLSHEAQFAYLFFNCTALRTAPEFPAKTITDMCYYQTFYGCTNLAKLPELPATVMTPMCYYGMFSGCTSITEPCALPSTDLAQYCYMGMFAGCTSLTRAMVLPATALTDYCYASMFKGCSNLATVYNLPATELASNSYFMMFSDCSNLTVCPVTSVDVAGEKSCWMMFENCVNLKNVPERLATTMGDNCFYYMFRGCTSIKTAPILPATTLSKSCYCGMFVGCSSLTTAPVLSAAVMTENCYNAMFKECTSLAQAPVLNSTELAEGCYAEMFRGCTGITNTIELPATDLEASCYQHMFNGCIGLTSVPTLPATVMEKSCYSNMFNGCTGLTSVPANLLPSTELAVACYEGMFAGCTNLTVAPELPAVTMTERCYQTMFASTGLTETPYLPATTLAKGCYWSMFTYCASLNKITAMFVNYNVPNHDIWHMFNGTAHAGTFIKNANATWNIDDLATETDLYGAWSFSDVTP